MSVLVTGGARSGKSRFAEAYAARQGESGIYIATGQAFDDEMRQRIELHRRRRDERQDGFRWMTREEPYDVAQALRGLSREMVRDSVRRVGDSRHPIVLVDCLTLWLSNWLLRAEQEGSSELAAAQERVARKIVELTDAAAAYPGVLILVSNEVGDSIVPEYPLGRVYRDLAGVMNQSLAAVSEQVFLVTAGIPLELKSLAFRWDGG